MSAELHLTSNWPVERVLSYSPQITAAMKKIIERFPDDATLKSMADDVLSGAVQMWVMLDGDEFKGVVLTDFQTVPATGHKAARIVALGGVDGVDLCPHIATIEEWAWENNADCVLPVGREGWKRPLAKLGYSVERIVYRKDRPS